MARRVRHRPVASAHPPPDVMTVEEIRYWLRALTDKYGWGPTGLASALGTKHTYIWGKAHGTAWIYRTEQLRFSKVLKRIIAGELVHSPGYYVRATCKLADHPVPLPQPVRYEFDYKGGMLQRILARKAGTSTVPSFKKALENAGRWRECTFPEEERRERDT